MTEEVQTCGCKGVRFCAGCEKTERVKKLRLEEDEYKNYEIFLYKQDVKIPEVCPELTSTSSLEDIIKRSKMHTYKSTRTMDIPGLLLVPDFITADEEKEIMEMIDYKDWELSQSGRRKQDFGPKVNFKKRKVKTECFNGLPEYAYMLQKKMDAFPGGKLEHYWPIEMANLEYEEEKKSAIEMHIDDTWIWGRRLISINLLSGTVMTLANEATKQLCYVWMPHRSLLCMADKCRYEWKHGVNYRHIRGRRVALTMREPSPAFLEGGEHYEQYGRKLLEASMVRVVLKEW